MMGLLDGAPGNPALLGDPSTLAMGGTGPYISQAASALANAYANWWKQGPLYQAGNAPTPEARAAAQQQLTQNAMGFGTDAGGMVGGIRAYHGSPFDFDAFDASKIGTGEGAQAYGHGLYFAENPNVARVYQARVPVMQGKQGATINGGPIDWGDPVQTAAFEAARHNGDRQAAADFHARTFAGGEDNAAVKVLRSNQELPSVQFPGHMYEVDINADPSQMLDWDKPLSEQPQLQRALGEIGSTDIRQIPGGYAAFDRGTGKQISGTIYNRDAAQDLYRWPQSDLTGGEIYGRLARGTALKTDSAQPYATSVLNNAGIPGIQYLDQGSRSAGQGTRNYVIFDPKLISIIRKYGIVPPVAFGAAGLAEQPSQ